MPGRKPLRPDASPTTFGVTLETMLPERSSTTATMFALLGVTAMVVPPNWNALGPVSAETRMRPVAACTATPATD